MKRSFQNQKSENAKMQANITTLKTEKTNLQQHLLDLKRRVAELELMIGEENNWLTFYMGVGGRRKTHELTAI